jgi:hypothetical protein
MPRYKVSDTKGFQWGWLTSHCELPEQSAKALGAGLDIAVLGSNLAELELLAGMSSAYSAGVRKLLYLYFNVPTAEDKEKVDETVGAVMALLKTTREGLEKEKGELDIRQNEADTSAVLNGYVRAPLIGARGPIHINFKKVMVQDLRLGGVYWSGLIVHEATHRYAKTGDLVNEVRVNQERTDGYLGGDRVNTLAKFEQYRGGGDSETLARGKAVSPKANHITTAQHLTNADSFTWLFISMLQGRPDTLSIARRFGGIYADLRAAFGKFAEVQAAAISADELAIPGMVTIDEI